MTTDTKTAQEGDRSTVPDGRNSPRCGHKHAQPPIPDADWKCPKCGIGLDHQSGGFVIGDPIEGTDNCEQLHEDDGLYCYGCDYGISGKAFARLVAKRRSLVPCDHCKGSGFVAGKATR